MPSNSLGGFNLAAIADKTIAFLGSEFFPVNLFTTNLSKDIKRKGESVTTRIISSVTAQDLSSGGYAGNAQDVTSTPVTTTLSNFKGHVAEFKDIEVTKAGDEKWLMENFYEPTLEATVKSLVDDLLALATAANYSNATTKAVGVWDADALADVAGELSKRKVRLQDRSILMHPDYYTALSKDTSITDKSAFGNNAAIRDGVVSRVRGFGVYQYDAFPNNGENLQGIALGKSALVVAVRPVFKPNVSHVAIANRIEPKTGLPFQFRVWYDPSGGRYFMSAGFLYGVSVGDANALQRVVSA